MNQPVCSSLAGQKTFEPGLGHLGVVRGRRGFEVLGWTLKRPTSRYLCGYWQGNKPLISSGGRSELGCDFPEVPSTVELPGVPDATLLRHLIQHG